jgi:threonine aldolase
MIDLRSDTVTKPTPAMKQAMFDAELGDDVMGEDPTVNRLEERVAELLGKEAALFTCTATQANQIAVGLHCSPADELLISSTGHIGIYEAGAPAAISGVSMRRVDSPGGMLRVKDLESLPWPDDPHFPRTRLVCLENTTNMGGGYAYPLELMKAVSDWTKMNGLRIHLDGARFFNAVVSAGYSPCEVGELFDTVTLCFSKGLGGPMGAVLAGSKEQVHQGRRIRKRLGGAGRQMGIIAGGAAFALDNHVDRLVVDHENARQLAAGLNEIDGIQITNGIPESNLVFFEIRPEFGTPKKLEESLRLRGVRIGCCGKQTMRAVTHLDVLSDDISRAVEVVKQCLGG